MGKWVKLSNTFVPLNFIFLGGQSIAVAGLVSPEQEISQISGIIILSDSNDTFLFYIWKYIYICPSILTHKHSLLLKNCIAFILGLNYI